MYMCHINNNINYMDSSFLNIPSHVRISTTTCEDNGQEAVLSLFLI